LIAFFSIFPLWKANSATFKILVNEHSFVPSNISPLLGDTVKWILNFTKNHEKTIVCDGNFPGTFLPAGAQTFNFLLNDNSPEFTYKILVAGPYHYKTSTGDITGIISAHNALPVELSGFVATTIKNEVILDWSTFGEVNNDRFEIERVDISDWTNDYPKDLPFTTIGRLQGSGTSSGFRHYRFNDKNLRTGKYLYRLKQVDYNSNFIYHALTDVVSIGVPAKFFITQNYPNPFNPTTKINYELPVNGYVKISVLDITGKELENLSDEDKEAGYYTLEFNATGYSSGIYYLRFLYSGVNGKPIQAVNKMVLAK